MKVFTIINPETISNIYFITDDNQKYGIIIDPGSFAINVYKEIKGIGAEIKMIIVTQNIPSKTRGIPLIKKIYDAEILSHNTDILNYKSKRIKEGDLITLGEIAGNVLETHLLSFDSISLVFGNSIFVGNLMEAGKFNSFKRSDKKSLIINQIIKKYFIELPYNTIIYPGKGPATTMEIELNFNPYFIRMKDANK